MRITREQAPGHPKHLCLGLIMAAMASSLVACQGSAPAEEQITYGFDSASTGGKADGFGGDPEMWRDLWYTAYAHKLDVPVIGPVLPPNGEIVLLIPGTTIGPEFYDLMRLRLERDGYTPIVWAPADLFTESLALGAERIGTEVARILATYGPRRIHIIAECDGGIATRYYVQVLGGDANVNQVITFVSAHNGTPNAAIGALTTGWQALYDLAPDSAFMREVNTAPFPAGLNFTSIYSCWDEYIQPFETARVPGAVNVEFCSRYTGHFDGFWDQEIYDRMLGALRGETTPVSY